MTQFSIFDIIQKQSSADRSKYIGGSDCAIIMGQSRWSTPLKLFMEKTKQIEPADLSNKENVYWGNVMEEIIRQEVEKRLNTRILKPDSDKPYISKQYDFIGCQLDGVAVDNNDQIFEFKTASEYKNEEWEADKAPIEYILQCQHNMYVANAKECILAVLIGGNRLVIKKVVRDDDLIEKIVQKEVDFWLNNVQADIPPIAISNDNMEDYYPESNGQEIELTEDNERIIAQIAETKATISELKKSVDEWENIIKQVMGENEVAKGNNYTCTWKRFTSVRIDTDKLKDDGLYDKYCKESNTARFNIKRNK